MSLTNKRQAYHWNYPQCTLHPIVIYYKKDGIIEQKSFCFLSDVLNRLLLKCNDRNKKQNDLFHWENWPITPENWPISALFGVKNVVDFSNSSRQ